MRKSLEIAPFVEAAGSQCGSDCEDVEAPAARHREWRMGAHTQHADSPRHWTILGGEMEPGGSSSWMYLQPR